MFKSSNNSRLLCQYISSSLLAGRGTITIRCISSCYNYLIIIYWAMKIVTLDPRHYHYLHCLPQTHLCQKVPLQRKFLIVSNRFSSLLLVASASKLSSRSSKAICSCLRASANVNILCLSISKIPPMQPKQSYIAVQVVSISSQAQCMTTYWHLFYALNSEMY